MIETKPLKIIDSHVHIGSYGPYEIKVSDLVDAMDWFGVTQAVVSDIGLNSLDEKGIERYKTFNTTFLNNLSLDTIKPYGKRFLLLYWIRPLFDQNEEELTRYLLENRDQIGGLKVHPKTAGIPFSSSNYRFYIDICKTLNLPFCIHTQPDGYSNLEFIYQAAMENPEVCFIAVHMDLGGDREKAADLIADCPNLYGDTTLVSKEETRRAIDRCGTEKILFGTDALVFGRESYLRYDGFYDMVFEYFGRDGAENVFYHNARKLFFR